MRGQPSLAGHTVLIMEDEFYMAEDAAAAVRGAGGDVIGPCSTEADAFRAIEGRSISVAMLDVNLGSGPSFAVARSLQQSGAPFLFLIGYDFDVIPAEFASIVKLQKPAEMRKVVRCLAALANA